MPAHHQATLSVPATHPALPGHFPGTPVVPGVLLMDLVLQCAEGWLQGALTVQALRQVKFHTPLLPDETAELTVDLEGERLAFRIVRGAQLIAQGAFILDLSGHA